MVRINYSFSSKELYEIAEKSNLKLVWRVARCQHGKTRHTTCAACENGYSDDASVYANINSPAIHPISKQKLVAVTDDMEDVFYIPERYEEKIVI